MPNHLYVHFLTGINEDTTRNFKSILNQCRINRQFIRHDERQRFHCLPHTISSAESQYRDNCSNAVLGTRIIIQKDEQVCN